MENLDQNQIWLLVAVAVGAFILGRMSRSGSGESSAERAMRERQRAEEIMASLSPDAQAQVDELMRAGKKIDAIRFVRESTGCGLKEAKDAVETR